MIRTDRVRPAHARGWADLRAALWPDARADEIRGEIEAILAGPPAEATAFVALTVRDEIVGFAEASVRHDPVNGCDTRPVAFLEGLYVSPSHRRMGAGAELLAAVEAWGRAAGFAELGSDADCANPDGVAFHAALGFEETEHVVFFRKPL